MSVWNLPSPVTSGAEALRVVAIFMPTAHIKVRGSIICSTRCPISRRLNNVGTLPGIIGSGVRDIHRA